MKTFTKILSILAITVSITNTAVYAENSTVKAQSAMIPIATAPISLQKLWEIDGLSMPESVLADPNSDWIYISNTHGKATGFISRVNKSGKVDTLHWIEGIQYPTGMAIYQNKLYVVNKKDIIVIDTKIAKVIQSITSDGKWLNDITVSQDGTFYVGDLVTGHILTFKAGDKRTQPWLQNEALKHTNGLLADGDNLMVGTVGTALKPDLPAEKRGSLYRVSIVDKSVKLIKNSDHLGNFDGVMKLGKGVLTTVSLRGHSYFINNKDDVTKITQLEAGKIMDGSLENNVFYAPYMHDGKLIAYSVNDESF